MKTENLIYIFLYIGIIAASVMKIWHIAYADAMLIFSFAGMGLLQSSIIIRLKQRIKELEG